MVAQREPLRATAGRDVKKLHYDAETDSLYIELKPKPSVDSREIADGLVVDFDTDGNVGRHRHRTRLDEARPRDPRSGILPATRVRIA